MVNTMNKCVLLILCAVVILTSSCTLRPSDTEKTPYFTPYPRPEGEVMTKEYSAEDIKAIIDKVNMYFIENIGAQTNNWDDAVYHSGNIRAFMATGNIEYYKYTYEYAKKHEWKVNDGQYTTNGDDYCISQVYIDLYRLAPDDEKLKDTIKNADFNANKRTTYTWVDLLYMASSVFSDLSAIKDDAKYADDAFRAYKVAKNIMWDEDDSLWYRDANFVFKSGKQQAITPDGKKVYWSRGNGWAFAALAKTLEGLDKNHEAYDVYMSDFKAMAKSLKERQREDGIWNANLDDPNHFGGIESSGTALFMNGYALGIRKGWLDYDEYFETLKKAYDGLVEHCINEEGRLLYVQPGSNSPQIWLDYENEEKRRIATRQFAVGIFIMGASELMMMCEDYFPLEIDISGIE